MMKRVLCVCVVVLGLLAGGVQAAVGPQQLVEETSAKVMEKLKQDEALIKSDPKHLVGLIDRYILPHFDFERMARWVLGKYWRRATPEQRQRFIEEFRALLVRTYATSLTDFTDQPITYLPFRDDLAKGDVTVKSEVAQPGGLSIPIDYRLHLKNGEWKVYDIVIDDVSLVTNYRSSFAREIKRRGIQGLIDRLAERNRKVKQ